MVNPTIKVLSVSDKVENHLLDAKTASEIGEIDLILACGDLPYYYLENLFEKYEVPLLFVRGNHDKSVEYGARGPRSAPISGINLHNNLVELNNMLFLGFEGSVRYKTGPFMYTQLEMWLYVLSKVPRLLWNKLIYGRFLDVLVTHAPTWKVNDAPDPAHQGFKAFAWLIKNFKPAFHIHGHIHIYEEQQAEETIFHATKVINTYKYKKSILKAGKRHYEEKYTPRPMRANLNTAIEDFRDARRRAAVRNVLSAVTGQNDKLLAFDQTIDQLSTKKSKTVGLQTIPLDAIVGSVSRHKDFDRKFFPRSDHDQGRWTRVKTAFSGETLAPIDVYQIGEIYFVLDGNHRVSITRQNGDSHIRAYVTVIESKVPITPDDQPDDIIIKATLAKFLEDTGLSETRPDIDFTVTEAGAYSDLREQISIHHYVLELQQHYPVDFKEAVVDWVDAAYLPVVRVINEQGLLRDFPGRTPTDLFMWLTRYQNKLRQTHGWHVEVDRAAETFAEEYSLHPQRIFKRLKENFQQAFIPANFGAGPPPGDWRKIHAIPRKKDKLFSAILVGVTGNEAGWQALDQAAIIAKHEEGALNGIHIERKESEELFKRELQNRFEAICKTANVPGELLIEPGEVSRLLAHRARWNDLIVLNLAHPPGNQPIARLRSGLRTLIQTSPRPLLAVPTTSPMQHALLAYDGSAKANEALYLATYLVKNWQISLVVLSAADSSAKKENPLAKAQEYLEARGVSAKYVQKIGSPGNVIRNTREAEGCDFIIMGGYGYKPVLEVILGSTVDQVLRENQVPILICR